MIDAAVYLSVIHVWVYVVLKVNVIGLYCIVVTLCLFVGVECTTGGSVVW